MILFSWLFGIGNEITHAELLISRELEHARSHAVHSGRASFAFMFPRHLLEQTKREIDRCTRGHMIGFGSFAAIESGLNG